MPVFTKPLILFACLIALGSHLLGQSAAINTTGASADPSAILDVQATDKGMLIPRMSTPDREGINNPAEGLMVYDTDSDVFWYYDGTAWTPVGARLTQITNPAPAAGTIRWNATSQQFEGYTGTAWVCIQTCDPPLVFPPTETNKLLPSDGSSADLFGWSVAIEGDYALIGAYSADGNVVGAGAAYVFHRNGNVWTQQAKLVASDGASGDVFGWSVAISGEYAVIGARRDGDNGFISGSAYIFVRNGTTWSQQDKLLASDGVTQDVFGTSVSISGDYAIVGANGDDDNGSFSGSAYIFHRSGVSWSQQAKLLPSDGATNDQFGAAVAISGDYAISGAAGDDDSGFSSGSAYMYHRNGVTWTQTAKITASDAISGDLFGGSVAIDGDRIAIGARGDDNGFANSGSVYVYERVGSAWSGETKLIASDEEGDDELGWSVSISEDYVVTGAFREDANGNNAGAAYVFRFDNGSWTEQVKLLASDGAADDNFGYFVGISGSHVLVGSPFDDDNGGSSGSAYIFQAQ